MRVKPAIFSALLALAAIPQAHAGVTVHVASDAAQMDVTLADDYIAVQSDKLRTIYDFSARHRIQIDPVAGTYVDYSLFDTLGFRIMESDNRRILNSAMASAKLDAALGRSVDIENELSVTKDTTSVVDESADGDTRRFASGGIELASWSKSGVKVSEADSARFAQFVRYSLGGHPLLLEFSVVNPAKPEQYADATRTLVDLRKLAPRKAHVLKLFEANHRFRQKQYKESRQLFQEVLEANPVLGGAYKDLGDLMLMQYDSPSAWRSWDAGRRLSPDLPNFQPVFKFEADMKAQHPEYF